MYVRASLRERDGPVPSIGNTYEGRTPVGTKCSLGNAHSITLSNPLFWIILSIGREKLQNLKRIRKLFSLVFVKIVCVNFMANGDE